MTGSLQKSAYNTSWCLLGCAIGDFGAILVFQLWSPEAPALLVMMGLAIMSGLLTNILLETLLLFRAMALAAALKTAFGMSLASMLVMEIAMDATDYMLVGKAVLTWWSVFPSLLAGFLTPWIYT